MPTTLAHTGYTVDSQNPMMELPSAEGTASLDQEQHEPDGQPQDSQQHQDEEQEQDFISHQLHQLLVTDVANFWSCTVAPSAQNIAQVRPACRLAGSINTVGSTNMLANQASRNMYS